jgi:tetratricopeptide (TPR) repeat protein
LERALRLFGENGHQDGELLVLGNLGLALRLVGRLEESVQRFEQALRIARYGDDQMKVAGLLNNLAATQLALGNTEAALANASTAVRLHDEIDDRRGLAYAHDTVGAIQLQRGSAAEAIAAFEAALRIEDEEELPEGGTMVRLGRAWLMAGDRRQARACWQEAVERFDRVPPGDRGSDAERQTIVSLLDEAVADDASPMLQRR